MKKKITADLLFILRFIFIPSESSVSSQTKYNLKHYEKALFGKLNQFACLFSLCTLTAVRFNEYIKRTHMHLYQFPDQ